MTSLVATAGARLGAGWAGSTFVAAELGYERHVLAGLRDAGVPLRFEHTRYPGPPERHELAVYGCESYEGFVVRGIGSDVRAAEARLGAQLERSSRGYEALARALDGGHQGGCVIRTFDVDGQVGVHGIHAAPTHGASVVSVGPTREAALAAARAKADVYLALAGVALSFISAKRALARAES